MTTKIQLGIIGTGGMANHHAKTLKEIDGVELAACCDINIEKGKAFTERHGIPSFYGNMEQLLDSETLDAVSIVTPDTSHAALSLKAIERGLHILCEKPLATSFADAERMVEAAENKGVINMVNFSYRSHSAIQKAHQLIRSGELGTILHVEASYLQSWLVSDIWGNWRENYGLLWRLSTAHGSNGVLGDLGVHLIDMVQFTAGTISSVQCNLKTFTDIKGEREGDFTLDANDSAVINTKFAGGALGTIHTSRYATGHLNSILLRIYGDQGAIIIDLDKDTSSLQICRGEDVNSCEWKTLDCGKTPNIHKRFIQSIITGKNDQPDFACGAVVQKVIDSCFLSDEKRVDVELKV